MHLPLQAEQGSVTAEFAVTLPAFVIVLGIGLGAIGAVNHQSVLSAIARQSAGQVARGIEAGAIRAHIAEQLPRAQVDITSTEQSICVEISDKFEINFLGPVSTPSARSCSFVE